VRTCVRDEDVCNTTTLSALLQRHGVQCEEAKGRSGWSWQGWGQTKAKSRDQGEGRPHALTATTASPVGPTARSSQQAASSCRAPNDRSSCCIIQWLRVAAHIA